MVKTKKVFLDANVAADWIAIHSVLERKNKRTKEKILLENYEKNVKAVHCYNLLETIRKNRSIPNLDFFISTFTLVEIVNVISTGIKLEDLKVRGIPPQKWFKCLYEYKFTLKKVKDIIEKINLFEKSFRNRFHLEKDDYNPLNAIQLIVENISVPDSILISIAIEKNSNYFVTHDEDLINLKEYDSLKIVKSTEILNWIKHHNKKFHLNLNIVEYP